MNPVHEEHEDDRDEQLAAYVLGALEPAEAVGLEAHLAGCERCRAELRRLEPAVRALGSSVPQLDPPRRLRRKTMAAARAEAAASPAEQSARTWRPHFTPVAAGVAAVLIAVSVGAGYLAGSDGPSTTTVAVEATADGGPGGNLLTRGDEATLEVTNLPRLRKGDVYQAWLQRGEVIEPSTTFIVDRDGRGAAAISDVSGAQQVMVTREPRGGSTTPSTAPILRASLTSS